MGLWRKQRTKSQNSVSIPRSQGYEANQADMISAFSMVSSAQYQQILNKPDSLEWRGRVRKRGAEVAPLMIHATGGEESQLRQQLQHEAWPVGSSRGIKAK